MVLATRSSSPGGLASLWRPLWRDPGLDPSAGLARRLDAPVVDEPVGTRIQLRRQLRSKMRSREPFREAPVEARADRGRVLDVGLVLEENREVVRRPLGAVGRRAREPPPPRDVLGDEEVLVAERLLRVVAARVLLAREDRDGPGHDGLEEAEGPGHVARGREREPGEGGWGHTALHRGA